MSQTGGFQHIIVKGSPFERGVQYGQQAAQRIRGSIDGYRKVFSHHAQLTWQDAVERASAYGSAIEAYLPAAMEEMRGIAEGAGLPFAEILTLNARSELMFASKTPERAAGPGECSSLAILPEFTANGHMLVGQNWDWLPFALDTTVLLQAERDDGPNYFTVVEAGLLAKVGVNAAGIGVCTNTLVSTLDRGAPGVPYHIVLRKLLDSRSMDAAAKAIYSPTRSLSANYLIAESSGLAFNAETLPGGGENVRTRLATNGVLVHTNHFLDPQFAQVDARIRVSPSTIFRLDMLERHLQQIGKAITIQDVADALSDERNYPCGVSAHPDPSRHPFEQWCTAASVIMDLTSGQIHIAAGAPTVAPYRQYDFHKILGNETNTRPRQRSAALVE